jgi:hypothetical protein
VEYHGFTRDKQKSEAAGPTISSGLELGRMGGAL